MFSKTPSSAAQAMSKGNGGTQQHEPLQPSSKGPVSHFCLMLPFSDTIKPFLLVHTFGFDQKQKINHIF